MKKLILIMVCAGVFLAAGFSKVFAEPLFRIETGEDWAKALEKGNVVPMPEAEWQEYMDMWDPTNPRVEVEGEPYPQNSFAPATLYVYGGGMYVDPQGDEKDLEPGLVMAWDTNPTMGSFSSAWEYVYDEDPDLSNCTITITVVAPQFDMNGNQINTVSFGMRDITGAVRSWNWQCGPVGSGTPIEWFIPKTISINTAITGVGAAVPTASGYTNTLLPIPFDITKVLVFIVDENAVWQPGTVTPPPPGTTIIKPWNLWNNLSVARNASAPIIAGINIDIHQDIDPSGQIVPNDFHVEGRIESGNPGGNWGSPPVLVQHIDDLFPNFNITISPDTTDPGQNWFIVKADWWGKDVPYCTILHLGLEFEVTCHNIIIDLVGWWTKDGQRVQDALNQGFVPVLGFNVQDGIGGGPDNREPQFIRIQNGDADGQIEPGEIEVEILQMQLAKVEAGELHTMLGENPFAQLRLGGLQEDLPWVTVPPEKLPTGGFMIDSFFDVFFEIDLGPDSFTLAAGDFLIAKEEIQFTNNSGETDLRWIFEIHEAHQENNDLGDAPDSSNHTIGQQMTAYPKGGPAGVVADYPTVYDGDLNGGSPPYGPIHWQPHAVAHLGQAVTGEQEADIGPDMDPTNNIIPQADAPDRDFADDGVLGLPFAFPSCKLMGFRYLVNVITPNVDLYVNVWFDWNRDGDWDDTFNCVTASGVTIAAPEWAVQNQLLSGLPVGLNTVTSLPFRPFQPSNISDDDPIWMRITLTGVKVRDYSPASGGAGYGGSGPAAGYNIGETEDYYFVPKKICDRSPDTTCDKFVNFDDFAKLAASWLQPAP